MSVAKVTRSFVDSLDEAKLFTYDDVPSDNKQTVAIELSRLYKKGIIKKVSKGKFYKPKKRIFGEIEPSSDEKISSYIGTSDDIAYETGLNSYRQLGLTTQVAKSTTIATNKSYKKVELDNIKIKFVPKRVDVPKDDILLVQILDAIKDIKKIPDNTPEKAFGYLKEIIKKLSKEQQIKMAQYAVKYTPRTRALVGAVLKEIGLWEQSFKLKETLNPMTKYKVGISKEILPSKEYWNII